MKKNINKKNLVYLLILLFIPILLEFFLSNIGLIINNVPKTINYIDISKLNLHDFETNNNKLISTTTNASFTYNLKKKYVKKFQLNYNSKNNIKYTLIVDGYNAYGNKITKKTKYVNSNHTNLISKNLNMYVNKITIKINEKNVGIENIKINNQLSFNLDRYFFILLLTLSIIICINFYIKKDNRLYILYFIVTILAGISFIVVEPNLATITWDEAIHYNSTNGLLKGKFVNISEADFLITDIGITFPSSYEEKKNLSGAINRLDFTIMNKLIGTNIIPYSNYVFIPSALGRNIFKLAKFKPTLCLKVGKLINLLIFAFIFSYAIKIAKVGKRSLFVLGLIPTTVFQAISYSKDSFIIACITLSMVVFINIISDKKEKIDFKNIFLFTVPLLIACFAKAIYCPLLLLMLFIPRNKFISKKLCYLTKIIIFILFILMMSTFGINVITNADNMGDIRGGHTNVAEQANLIINHPVTFIKICFKNIIDTIGLLFNEDDGLIFFAYLSGSKWKLSLIILLLLIFTIFTNYNSKDEEKNYVSGINKFLIFVFSIGIFIGISLALYLTFTEVGKLRIEGVQSRYYLPLLYPIIIIFISTKIKSNYDKYKINMVVSTLSTIVMFLSILVVCKIC